MVLRPVQQENFGLGKGLLVGKQDGAVPGEIGRPISPGGKGQGTAQPFAGREAQAERICGTATLGPPIPQPGRRGDVGPCFVLIVNPEQFEVAAPKEEAAIGRALAGMLIRRSFNQAGLQNGFCFRRTRRCTNEDMMDLECQLSGRNLRTDKAEITAFRDPLTCNSLLKPVIADDN